MGSLLKFCTMLLLTAVLLLLPLSTSLASGGASYPATRQGAFIQCFIHHTSSSNLVLTQNAPSFDAALFSSIQNGRFANSTSRPALIVTPTDESHVRASVVCARRHRLRVRARSGGHDLEGLSYRSVFPRDRFVMVDLARLRSVGVDVDGRTAWVGAGATLGELYYEVAKRSKTLAFPAGVFPTVGVGGHVSGGGAGTLTRKYGLAADNVVDAVVVDASGQILDRRSMGKDLFWAIRGGGGGSFGIVLSFKVKLVEVPATVTVFTVAKTIKQGAAKLITKWQHVAPRMVDDLYLSMTMVPDSNTKDDLLVYFQCLFLGSKTHLLPIMESHFPELALGADDCEEMSWIESVLYYADYFDKPIEALLGRRPQLRVSYEFKCDHVEEPIPEEGWHGILRWLLKHGGESWRFDVDAFGGKMEEIPETATPYPHRRGNLYRIVSAVAWTGRRGEDDRINKHVEWMRGFYEYMTPYVSKNPRGAYVNIKDLDLGWNEEMGKSTYEEARVWGEKYFKGNFERLARVKFRVDPENFFWNEQSIPPLHAKRV